MFREMRRKKQALSIEENDAVLQRGSFGVLALIGDNAYPYAVPLSYVYDSDNRCFYFHSAKNGHKLDAIKESSQASFCVVDRDTPVPEEYTTYFRSVVAFGRLRILEDEKKIYDAAQKLAAKYVQNSSYEERQEVIRKDYSSLCMIEFQIEHLTGKEAIELKREKEKDENEKA